MKLIYRISDKLIVGTVTPPHPEAVELLNICRSQLGGVPADYALAEAPSKSGDEVYEVNPAGAVLVKPNPVIVTQRARRATGRAKLRALGLSNGEIDALGIGGS